MYEALLVEKQGQVDWVTLNRPDAYNTLNRTLTDELQDYFGRLYTDHETRIVVLKGAGQGYCGGLDLKEAAGRNSSDEERSVAEGYESAPCAVRELAAVAVFMPNQPARPEKKPPVIKAKGTHRDWAFKPNATNANSADTTMKKIVTTKYCRRK